MRAYSNFLESRSMRRKLFCCDHHHKKRWGFIHSCPAQPLHRGSTISGWFTGPAEHFQTKWRQIYVVGGVRAAMANFWHSGGHITGVPALPLPCSIPQIPGMTEVLPYLSPVAALRVICTHSLNRVNLCIYKKESGYKSPSYPYVPSVLV